MLGQCPVMCPLNRVKITGNQHRASANICAGPPQTKTLGGLTMSEQERKVDSSGVAIRRATKNEQWSAIAALLHRAYAVHAARGLRFYASYQDENVTRERADEGECYLALIDSVVVGTVTALPGGRKSECSWYVRPDVASMGHACGRPCVSAPWHRNVINGSCRGTCSRVGCSTNCHRHF